MQPPHRSLLRNQYGMSMSKRKMTTNNAMIGRVASGSCFGLAGFFRLVDMGASPFGVVGV